MDTILSGDFYPTRQEGLKKDSRAWEGHQKGAVSLTQGRGAAKR